MSGAARQRVVAVGAPSTRSASHAVELHGVGQVGAAFLRLAEAAGLPVAAVHRSRDTERRPTEAPGRIVVDATPPRLSGGAAEDWISFLEASLRGGTPVATCNKAPLALAWARLADAARDGGVALAATGTVGGGTPILPTLRSLHRERPIAAVEATLSGTLGVVVPAVKAGATVAAAVAEAQRAGFCEPDPTLDLDGTDAWAKACILHNALWPGASPRSLAGRDGPLEVTEAGVRRLRCPAVVAAIRPGSVQLALSEWDAPGPGIQVRARLASGERVTLSGAGAGPVATAATLLADVRLLLGGSLPPGIH